MFDRGAVGRKEDKDEKEKGEEGSDQPMKEVLRNGD